MREALNRIIFEVSINNDGEIATEQYKIGDLVNLNKCMAGND